MDPDDFGDDADLAAAFQHAERSLPTQAAVPASHPVSSSSSAAARPPAATVTLTTTTTTTNTPTTPAGVQQPKPQALPVRRGPSAILVSARQKGNPILNGIQSVAWEYADIVADYVVGNTSCVLFLSLKYHRLHPEYIYGRMRALAGKYRLRVLLTLVDIDGHEEPLRELAKTGLVNNWTLLLCWSAPEAGRYLSLLKTYEHSSPNAIRAQQATGYNEKLVEFVTVPRSINKTDAISLVGNFGSVRAAVEAGPEEIGMIGGWGEKKVNVWCRSVREDFRVGRAKKRGGGETAREPTRDRVVVDDDPLFAADDEEALEP
ncbi:MAG: ssDNA endonuclease and repair protein rad10 [Phylliscum demangeonii]|nr:MAG: ssDNA endonuclease and repair protein rad10 [Phylliscum demangeonii]